MTFAATINQKNIRYLVVSMVLSMYQITIPPTITAVTPDQPASVVIAQLQTGAIGSASQELVTIYNNSDTAVDVTNWCLTYSSSSDATQTVHACFFPPENFKYYLSSHEYVSFATTEFMQAYTNTLFDYQISGGFSASGGHIKLLRADQTVVDTLGWGSASHPEITSASAHSTGKTLQRKGTAVLQDTNNNAADFISGDLKLPTTRGLYEEAIPVDICSNIDNFQSELPIDYLKTVSGECFRRTTLIITELLPDATGADAGKEFIEIYNPSDYPVNLKNYTLQVGPSFTKSYPLPDSELPAHTYRALADTETHITLPNTSASVRILGPDQEVINTSEAYNLLGEMITWAYADDFWQISYTATPGTANIITTELETNQDDDMTQPVACKVGQERNPETGRCHKITVIAAIAICKPGQSRNPDTGRCRSTINAIVGPTPCKTDQERNLETGRCRKVTITTVTACPAGQERNPETKRCRKIVATGLPITNKVQDVSSPLLKNNIKWWFAGAGGVGSISYAGYEWRREALKFVSSLKGKFK